MNEVINNASNASFFLQINGVTVFSAREFGKGDVADLSGIKPHSFFRQLRIELIDNQQQRIIDNQSEVLISSNQREVNQSIILQAGNTYYSLRYIVTHEDSALMPGVQVRDGIVFFEDLKSFSRTISNLNELSDEDLEFWEDGLDFDNSLRRKYESSFETLEDIDLESSSELYIPDESLATLVNEDGIFVVGDEIHKITNNHEYVIKGLDFEKLNQIDDLRVDLPENVSKFEIQKGLGDESNVSRFDIPKALGDESLTVARVAYGTHTRKKTPYADIGINNL
ncbi:MAG: hypothetical protein F6K62_16055, partial [Sphaerospermopsis sp. SIO1G2]|nr:hypothetical protein [Sphaerospermopsis sp. SIO1G2]